MANSNVETDEAFDAFRYDFVAYLALRLGIPHEVALRTLGDWLVEFEPQHETERNALPCPANDRDADCD